jgi:hypothetical protein
MQKPKREGLKAVTALSIKPPAYTLDPNNGDDHKYKCVYVTDQGKQITQICTFDVWKRCEGKKVTGRPRTGLSSRLHNTFILWVDATQYPHEDPAQAGIIVDIDVLPETFYQNRQVMPVHVAEQETIEFKVGPIGSIEITKIPSGVNKQTIVRLIRELNHLTEITSGLSITGGFEVVSVDGNTVSVLPPAYAAV